MEFPELGFWLSADIRKCWLSEVAKICTFPPWIVAEPMVMSVLTRLTLAKPKAVNFAPSIALMVMSPFLDVPTASNTAP